MTIRLKFSDSVQRPAATERPLRVTIYAERPDAILIYVPVDTQLRLPKLRPPFTRQQILEACGEAGIAVRVIESKPGRHREAIDKAVQEDSHRERTLQGQAHRFEAAAQLAETITLPDATTDDQRAQLILQKEAVESELQQVKKALSKARNRAFQHGKYDAYFREKERRAEQLNIELLAIQKKLGELKKIRKADNIAKHNAEEIAKCFMDAAVQLLPPDQIEKIWNEVSTQIDVEVDL